MKNESIVIALIFLAIVALFAFNFQKMTGFAPKTITHAPEINLYKTNIYGNKVKARIINPGEKINAEIKINQGCIAPELEIYFVRNGIVGTRKAVVKYKPDIADCARPSTKGAKIHCTGFKYCKGDLIEDKIKKIIKTHSDWQGNYIVRVYYYDKKGKKAYKDSEEFKIS